MSLLKPKQPIPTPLSGYSTGPTPIADAIEWLFKGAVILVMVPIFAVILVMAPAALLVYGIGDITGLTAAWAQLVAEASTAPGSAVAFTSILMLNFGCGAIVSLFLAIPTIKRSLEQYRLRDVAHSLGTSTAVAAFQLSAGAILLQIALGMIVAIAMTGLGMLFPAPFGYETVVAPDTLAYFIVTGGVGGGWPPTADTLSVFALLALSILMLAGSLLGASLWLVLGYAAQRLVPMSATEAAGGGASALGSVLANALTRGEDRRLPYSWVSETVGKGMLQGALSGALFGALVLAGAAVLGVG